MSATAPLQASDPVPGGERAVTRAIAVGFLATAFVAVGACVTLMVLLLRVDAELDTVREDGRAVQDALVLALTVREHYVHEAHTVVVADRHQLSAHHEWIGRVHEQVAALAPRVPPTERGRLQHLSEVSEQLDQVFVREVVPAALERNGDRLAAAHARSVSLHATANQDADAVVHALEARMARARQRASQASIVALITGCVGVGAIVALALVFSLRIRSAILLPMQSLAGAARRVGAGEPVEPLSPLGRGEIARVALAFDAMVAGLRERERRLVESERMAAIGELAAGVAHEINNPVAIIRGYLKTMIEETEPGELRDELGIIDEEAAACQHIVEDLVAFARAPQLDLDEVQMARLLEDSARRFERAAAVSVRVRAEPATLRVDPVRARQVVANLLRNASDATPPGDEIELIGEETDAAYRVRVLDRGPGIPEALREQVFEPFRSGKAAGTGLGLAVCRSIVEAHGGSIVARDREGGGTEMRVTLPAPPPTD